MATNTCLLYGTTNWININILIIIVTFMLVAVFYALSNTLPIIQKEKLKDAAKSELTQGFLSVIIIVILATVATTACSISSGISMSLTHQSLSPFQYSEYYVGNLSANTGLNLLANVYSISVTYAVEAQVLQTLGSFLNTAFTAVLGTIFKLTGLSQVVSILLGPAITNLSQLFSILSSVFLEVIAPLITIAVGLLFIQFLALPILQYTAFSVILPLGIAMRSLAFLGTSLKYASNVVLAMAIAGYIVYPLMISFNGYMIAWIFSPSNPASTYIGSTYVVPKIPTNNYFSTAPSSTSTTGFFGSLFNSLAGSGLFTPFLASSFNSFGLITPFNVVQKSQLLITETAQFLFAAVVLFVIDIAVTLGFAIGLSKALNSGIEGSGSFWSGI